MSTYVLPARQCRRQIAGGLQIPVFRSQRCSHGQKINLYDRSISGHARWNSVGRISFVLSTGERPIPTPTRRSVPDDTEKPATPSAGFSFVRLVPVKVHANLTAEACKNAALCSTAQSRTFAICRAAPLFRWLRDRKERPPRHPGPILRLFMPVPCPPQEEPIDYLGQSMGSIRAGRLTGGAVAFDVLSNQTFGRHLKNRTSWSPSLWAPTTDDTFTFSASSDAISGPFDAIAFCRLAMLSA
jgi:hypothetical protein